MGRVAPPKRVLVAALVSLALIAHLAHAGRMPPIREVGTRLGTILELSKDELPSPAELITTAAPFVVRNFTHER